jgi:hypothetical protein
MIGLPEYNYPAFIEATDQLRAAGFDVVSPHELDGDAEVNLATWGPADRLAALKRDMVAVLECDGVALLSGWTNSTGARAEVAVARAVPIPAYSVTEWLLVSSVLAAVTA